MFTPVITTTKTMRIKNDINHNNGSREAGVYECSIYFDSEEQMKKVLGNFECTGCDIDFPEISEDMFGNKQFTAWVGSSTRYGEGTYYTKKEFLSAVSKEARRANKQK